MVTVTTTGPTQAEVQKLRDDPTTNAAEVLGNQAVQEHIGRQPAPPPGRVDFGDNVAESGEGAVKTDPKSGRKTLEDGRVIHHGSGYDKSRIEVEEGDDLAEDRSYRAALSAVPAGGQLRSVTGDDGKVICYRVVDPEDSVPSFLWPSEDHDSIEVSGPLAKRVGKKLGK